MSFEILQLPADFCENFGLSWSMVKSLLVIIVNFIQLISVSLSN